MFRIHSYHIPGNIHIVRLNGTAHGKKCTFPSDRPIFQVHCTIFASAQYTAQHFIFHCLQYFFPNIIFIFRITQRYVFYGES